MKTLVLSSLFILLFTGCIQDSRQLTKEEVKEADTNMQQKKLNYRTGKYELKFICLNKIKQFMNLIPKYFVSFLYINNY